MALISVSNNALSNISVLPASIPTGALTLIKSITPSTSASIEFINGTNGVVLDGTYSSYVFKFIDIHPSINIADLGVNFSTDGGSNYNVTKTGTNFRAYHDEGDVEASLNYDGNFDIAQSTSDHILVYALGTDNDQSASGTLQLFNPSSTTYVKHYISRFQNYHQADFALDYLVAGYGNTTSAVNAVKFQMASGNIDDGTIKLYGVK